jgi:hypothetical protein
MRSSLQWTFGIDFLNDQEIRSSAKPAATVTRSGTKVARDGRRSGTAMRGGVKERNTARPRRTSRFGSRSLRPMWKNVKYILSFPDGRVRGDSP